MDDTLVIDAAPTLAAPPPPPSPCSSCGMLNPISHEYCSGCGAPLVTVTEVAQVGSLDTPRSPGLWRVYGVQTGLFGRQPEFDQLMEAMRNAFETSSSQLILLVGPDGMGKSRLVAELNEQLDHLFDTAHLVAGSCQAHTTQPYAPFARLIKNRFYIPKQQQGQVGRLKLTQGIKSIIRNPLSAEIAQLVGYLVGMPFPDSPVYERHGHDPKRILDRARSALVRLIERDAERQPLVLVFEDLHLATPETLSLIQQLHSTLTHAPIAIICAARPELSERAPWLFSPDTPRLHTVPLRPLADDDVADLVRDILRRADTIPEALIALICERAFGNPLSVEELIRILIGAQVIDTRSNTWTINTDPLDQLELPRTFEGMVQARLDALTPEEQALLDKAAVVGRVFWSGALRALDRSTRPLDFSLDAEEDSTDPATPLDDPTPTATPDDPWPDPGRNQRLAELLETLQRKDIIDLRDGDSAIPNQDEYVFRHAIERDLIYEALEPTLRASHHAHAAQWLERATDHDDALRAQHIDGIALHYERGGHAPHAAVAWHQA
ncbi:MAG: AAA family ATPase, partial [Myxococcota bacterium]